MADQASFGIYLSADSGATWQPISLARAPTPPPLPRLSIAALPDDAGLVSPPSGHTLPEIASALDPVTGSIPPEPPSPLIPSRRIRLAVSPGSGTGSSVLQWTRDLGVTERWQDIHPPAGPVPGQYDLAFPVTDPRGYFRLSGKE